MERTCSPSLRRGEARAAAQRLIDAGLPSDQAKVIPEDPEVQAEGRDVGTKGGFVGALFSFLRPRDDQDTYEEVLRRGGILVVAERVSSDLHDAALLALNREGAIDPGEGMAAWRLEGWTRSESSGLATSIVIFSQRSGHV